MAGDVFGSFKKSFDKGLTTISIKASSSLEKTKIRTHIDTLSSDIKNLTYSVGEKAYEQWENGNEDYSVLNDLFATIQQKKQEIENLNKEMEQIDERDEQILGSMATEVPKTVVEEQVATVSEPAAPVETTATEEAVEVVVVCPQCGAQYGSSVKFCRQCGNKLTE